MYKVIILKNNIFIFEAQTIDKNSLNWSKDVGLSFWSLLPFKPRVSGTNLKGLV